MQTQFNVKILTEALQEFGSRLHKIDQEIEAVEEALRNLEAQTLPQSTYYEMKNGHEQYLRGLRRALEIINNGR